MDPGTAAIATLASIAGVSGYGAMKLNKNQDVMIEQKVQERIAQTEERLKDTQEALQAVEAVKAKQDAQLIAIQKELQTLRNAKASIETQPVKRNPFVSRFMSLSSPPPVERDFTPVVTADPEDVTPSFKPEDPTIANTPNASPPETPSPTSDPTVSEPVTPVPTVSDPETISTPTVSEPVTALTPQPEAPAPIQPEQQTAFPPDSIAERLRIVKERAAKMKEDNGSDVFMSRMDAARKGALADVKQIATFPPVAPRGLTMTNVPPLSPAGPTIATLPKLQTPTTVPMYNFTAPVGEPTTLTASVPSTNRRGPPRAPPMKTTRQTRRKPVRPPPLPRGGLRKKKLRTRRGGKQRNVRRTGRS